MIWGEKYFTVIGSWMDGLLLYIFTFYKKLIEYNLILLNWIQIYIIPFLISYCRAAKTVRESDLKMPLISECGKKVDYVLYSKLYFFNFQHIEEVRGKC